MSFETLDESSFPILKGHCYVDEEYIRIVKDKPVQQSQIYIRIVMSILVSAYFIYRGVTMYGHAPIGIPIMYFFFVLVNVYVIIFSLNATVINDISWNKVRTITYKKGVLLNFRPVITIRYNDKNDKPKKRVIILPSMFKDGNQILNQARSIFSRYIH